MNTDKIFHCKISTEIVSTVEKFTIVEELYWFGPWWDGKAKIDDDTVSLDYEDRELKFQPLKSVPIDEIKSVLMRHLSADSLRRSSYNKSKKIGIGIGTLLFVFAMLTGKVNLSIVQGFLVLCFSWLIGIIMVLFIRFLHGDLGTGSLTEFIFKDSENLVFSFAVKPDQEQEVRDALTSVGLDVKEQVLEDIAMTGVAQKEKPTMPPKLSESDYIPKHEKPTEGDESAKRAHKTCWHCKHFNLRMLSSKGECDIFEQTVEPDATCKHFERQM